MSGCRGGGGLTGGMLGCWGGDLQEGCWGVGGGGGGVTYRRDVGVLGCWGGGGDQCRRDVGMLGG